MASTLKEVISKKQIQERVRELGKEISERYAGQELVVVCVLKGAVMFFADITRELPFSPEMAFVRLSSYGNDTQSSGCVTCRMELETDIENKHVLVIEDIVDTGRSLSFLLDKLAPCKPASMAICTLVSKTERREVDVPVDFVGFPIERGFIVGYGMDCAEKYRELDGVYEIVEE